MWAVCLLAALRGVDEIQERAQFCMTAIGQLPEAAVSHRAVIMQTERIARWYVLVYLCYLLHCLLHIISFLRIRGTCLSDPFMTIIYQLHQFLFRRKIFDNVWSYFISCFVSSNTHRL